MKIIRNIITTAVFMAAVAISAAPASATDVRDLRVTVDLQEDGSARITERWELEDIGGITEWYLVRSNLKDIKVRDLTVTDETGLVYVNEGEWDVHRTIKEKAGRCGIVTKSDGVEICWGVGSDGDHTFTASYTMTNVVKSLNDYDMVHMQFVSPGLSDAPDNVTVTIESELTEFADGDNRVWGFGYEGTCNFVDGKVVAQTTAPFQYKSSVIILLRIDKDIFNSSSIQDKDFEEVVDTAMEGSDWENSDDEDDVPFGAIVGGMAIGLFLAMFGIKKADEKNKMNVLGVKKIKEIGWCRDVPYKGDVIASEYILKKVGYADMGNRVAAAIILKMINQGYLTVRKDSKDKIEIMFNDNSLDPSSIEGKLYAMMKEASGEDQILQNREFSRWSARHTKTVSKWVDDITAQGRQRLIAGGWLQNGVFTDESKRQSRDLLGLKKFLKDFTLSAERGANEVGLWQDYLTFAALFGVADKVAKELKDINPKAYDEVMPYDYVTTRQLLYLTNTLSRSITNAKATYESKSGAAGGHGGHASFGGGGGFSGGGFGGGGR